MAREPDWSASAFRWQRRQTPFGSVGELRSIARPATLRLEDLQNVDEQKRLVEANTRQFVRGLPANNVLLTGARGTGKSSLVKACLPTFRNEGLRLVEVDKAQLTDLPEIVEQLQERPERFIVYLPSAFRMGWRLLSRAVKVKVPPLLTSACQVRSWALASPSTLPAPMFSVLPLTVSVRASLLVLGSAGETLSMRM